MSDDIKDVEKLSIEEVFELIKDGKLTLDQFRLYVNRIYLDGWEDGFDDGTSEYEG
jgi:hypothetical protein